MYRETGTALAPTPTFQLWRWEKRVDWRKSNELLTSSLDIIFDTSKPTTPTRARTMKDDWRASTRPPPFMTFRPAWPIGVAPFESRGMWPRNEADTWRTGDPRPTATHIKYDRVVLVFCLSSNLVSLIVGDRSPGSHLLFGRMNTLTMHNHTHTRDPLYRAWMMTMMMLLTFR